jgi:peptide/nickel transport system ATP-binding protein
VSLDVAKRHLGRALLRLLEPTSGQVLYGGVDVTSLSKKEMQKIRSKMQIIFQDPYSSLNPRMTVADILMEPMHLHNIGENDQEKLDKAGWLMEKVD